MSQTMLVSLHVRNLALIEETEVFFQPGLNILTGETGAGKSVILGSVALALGAKADRDMIRTGAEYALIELTFEGSEEVREALRRMDLPAEDNQEELIDKLLLRTAIESLPERDRKIIVLRYFRDMTQSEVAEKIGVSQVQVSRIESRIIKEFRQKLIG